MNIRISTTVNIDPAAWAADNGLDPADVRADVQAHAAHVIHEWLASLGVVR
jgi:hypothetical protein